MITALSLAAVNDFSNFLGKIRKKKHSEENSQDISHMNQYYSLIQLILIQDLVYERHCISHIEQVNLSVFPQNILITHKIY